jgi:hypothetical protein
MFDSKTTNFVKTRKKRIYSFLGTLFCTLVIVSSIGSSYAIRNSFAQQIQTQQPSTLTYNSPSNNSNSQVLCAHGMCKPSPQPTSRLNDQSLQLKLVQDDVDLQLIDNTETVHDVLRSR